MILHRTSLRLTSADNVALPAFGAGRAAIERYLLPAGHAQEIYAVKGFSIGDARE